MMECGGGTNSGPKARSRGRAFGDRVDLDVGGTVFATSVSTLVANSTYFESLFSVEWRAEGSGDDGVFVDQDPGPFAILLSFMRLGHVEAKDLTRNVLLQADFFGVEKLLAAVKYAAYVNMNPNFDGSDEECCAAFDEEFGSVSAAVSAGILPSRVQHRRERKEYGSIKVLNEMYSLEGHIDLIATLDVPTCQFYESTFEEGLQEEKTTLLDALNYLHRRGFTTLEEQTDQAFKLEGDVAKRFTFSRRAKGEKRRSHLADMIIYMQKDNDGPKEFAFLLEIETQSLLQGVFVYADNENLPTLKTLLWDAPEGQVSRPIPVCSSMNDFDFDVAPAMNWLQSESYRKEEKGLDFFLAEVWKKLLVKKGALRRHTGKFDLRLFSRTCPRRKDNYVRARIVTDQGRSLSVVPPT